MAEDALARARAIAARLGAVASSESKALLQPLIRVCVCCTWASCVLLLIVRRLRIAGLRSVACRIERVMVCSRCVRLAAWCEYPTLMHDLVLETQLRSSERGRAAGM